MPHPEGSQVLANTGIGDRTNATDRFPAGRSAPERSEDTPHPYLSGLLPQNVTPDPQKRSTRRAEGQLASVSEGSAGVLWLAAGEWICLDQQSIEAPVCTRGRVLE
jgi:hypothetical protein